MAKGDIKRRREIEKHSASLPSMTLAQEWEAQQACGTAWIGAKKGWCDVCAQEFEHDIWNTRKKHIVCPKCGTRLDVKKSPSKRKEIVRYYFHIITTAGDWQVVRTFHCRREARRVERFGSEILNPSDVQMYITEVFQKFMKQETRPMIIGLSVRGLHYYSDQWEWDSKWQIRHDKQLYTIWGWMAKKQDLLPELKMRGLKRLSENCSPYNQIESVFMSYQAEVLLKAGAMKLYDAFIGRYDSTIRTYWDSVRIALRHGYKVNDVTMWLDLLKLLHQNHKDMRNPHYICPDNLKEAHDEQLALREKILEKERKEKERKEAQRLAEQLSEDGKTNVAYIKKMGKVLGVMVKVGNMTLQPLQNIRDFFEEGSELNHCVFRNGYYKDDDCLIVGAKINGKRTETIEIDMKEWKIIQCRGKHNQPSVHHDKIMNAIKTNMDKFRRAAVCE